MIKDEYRSQLDLNDHSIEFQHKSKVSLHCVFNIHPRWKWLYSKFFKKILRPTIMVTTTKAGEPANVHKLLPGDEYTINHIYDVRGTFIRPVSPGLCCGESVIPMMLNLDGVCYSIKRDGPQLVLKLGW